MTNDTLVIILVLIVLGPKKNVNIKEKVYGRQLSRINWDDFETYLINTDWIVTLSGCNVDQIWSAIKGRITEVIDNRVQISG